MLLQLDQQQSVKTEKNKRYNTRETNRDKDSQLQTAKERVYHRVRI